jgi:Fe-S oxidoreductase
MTSGITKKKETLFFAPGCALMIYKPGLVKKIHHLLNEKLGKMDILTTCCQHNPHLPPDSKVINVCPGCDKRFEKNYVGVSTISLWEVINDNDFFVYPDYKKKRMSIIDACPTREKDSVQNALRDLLLKMNIRLVEPKNTKRESTCCGDLYYGALPTAKVKDLMIEKSSEMPVFDIVVHCVSCIIAVFNGHKNPKYMADLLFKEETVVKTFDLDEWHEKLTDFIDKH